MKIGIGTKNPAKTSAVKRLCDIHFHDAIISEYKAHSLVSEQPLSDEETLLGAKNRAAHVLELSDAQLAFGLEGGVKEVNGQMYICNWGALALRDGTFFCSGWSANSIARRSSDIYSGGFRTWPSYGCVYQPNWN